MKLTFIKNIVATGMIFFVFFGNALTVSARWIETSGGNSGWIDTTGGNSGWIDTTGGNSGWIDTTGGNSGWIDTTGSNSGWVNTVGGNSGWIETSGGNSGWINTVGGNSGWVSDTTGWSTVGWSTTPINTTANTGWVTTNNTWVNPGTVNTGWVTTNNTWNTGTNCPWNTTWNGSTCVSTTAVTVTNVCSDGQPPVNNSCVRTNTIPVVTNTVCSDGRPPVNNSCVRTTTVTVTNVCSDGQPPVNNSCVRTNTIPVVTNTICSDGQAPVNGSCVRTGTVVTTTNCPTGTVWNGTNCVQTVTGTVVTNTTCPWNSSWNGTSCVSMITPPVVTNTSCPSNTQYINGVCQQIVSSPVVTYQTCWDGSVIPTHSVCAAQYKVCSNGLSIPINQTCYVATTPVIAPIKITFNNVVTSLATEVTQNQGRCNGIGLIAQGAPSTGWFEYGETANLGRTTVSANIGTSDTAPFSNLLTNLKPSTKYYCRAVMQNKHGLVKGEVVSFTTKGKATTYVKPAAATPVKKPIATKVPVKNEVVCSDGTTISVKNQSAATLLTDGQKLVTLSIEKTEGKIASEGIVKFKVSFKNITDSRLTETVLKVKLPEEVRLLETSAGMYDAVTRTITLNQNTLDPYTEGTILFSGVVAKDAALGKTIVTNAYVAYTVPGTNTQDEVTAYVIGSVVPVGDTGSASVGEKKVIGAKAESKGFLPNSLIEWLALLAIIFIIFILARSIYASYKEGDSAHH